METLYLLAETEHGRLEEVMVKVRGIPRVVEVEPVTGPYDLLVKIQAPVMKEALDVVLHKIRKVQGIRSTETLVSVGGTDLRPGPPKEGATHTPPAGPSAPGVVDPRASAVRAPAPQRAG